MLELVHTKFYVHIREIRWLCAMHRERLACIEWQKSQTGENRLCRVCVCLFVCSSELKSNEFQLHRISCMAIQDERENSIVSLRNTEKHTHTH